MLIDIKEDELLPHQLLDNDLQRMLAPKMMREHGNAILQVQHQGDITACLHVTDVTATIEHAQALKKENPSGYSADRTYRQIGAVHPVIFQKYPHLKKDFKALKKWLMSPEGMPFRTVDKI